MVTFSVGFHKTDTRAPEAAAVVDVVVRFARFPQGVDEPAVSRPVTHVTRTAALSPRGALKAALT